MVRLSKPWDAFDPKSQRIPVNQIDHPESDERVEQCQPCEIEGCQGNPFSRDRTEERQVRSIPIIDMNLECFAGDVEFEVKGDIGGRKWGDIEMFRFNKPKHPFLISLCDEIEFHLPEGIAHLCQGCEGFPLGIETEIKRNRIKDITQHSGHREQHHFSSLGEGDPSTIEFSDQFLFNWNGCRFEMIIIPE